MPRLKVNGADLHYDEQGAGPETVVFAHGLLWSGRMFDRQVAALAGRYRCVTFDFRGQGGSEVTRGGYDMDSLAADAAALIAALRCAPCHFVGLSMGGFVGMRLAIRHSELVRSLVLIESTADPEPRENLGRYRLLTFVARWISLRLVAGPVMQIMFGKKFLDDPARAAQRAQRRRELTRNHRAGVARAVDGVIRRQGIYEQLGRIAVPTLILVGDQDVATPPARSERLHAAIAGSRLRVIQGAGHTSTLEEPDAVNAAVAEFLAGLESGAPSGASASSTGSPAAP
jgi:3-oxoadipate enol-lactonase